MKPINELTDRYLRKLAAGPDRGIEISETYEVAADGRIPAYDPASEDLLAAPIAGTKTLKEIRSLHELVRDEQYRRWDREIK